MMLSDAVMRDADCASDAMSLMLDATASSSV